MFAKNIIADPIRNRTRSGLTCRSLVDFSMLVCTLKYSPGVQMDMKKINLLTAKNELLKSLSTYIFSKIFVYVFSTSQAWWLCCRCLSNSHVCSLRCVGICHSKETAPLSSIISELTETICQKKFAVKLAKFNLWLEKKESRNLVNSARKYQQECANH